MKRKRKADCDTCAGSGVLRYDVGKRSEWRRRCPDCCEHAKRYRAPDGVRCETCGQLMGDDDGT